MLKYLAGVSTLALDVQKCVGCGMCTQVCPHAVLVLRDRRAQISERDRCMECGACARNCPTGAITVRAGVGCASGAIKGALGVKGDCCCSD